MKNYKAEFLKKFLEICPEYSSRLRSCLHSFDEKNLCPYHLEDDVWSHTMLVYSHIYIDDLEDENYINAILLMALTHDSGKIYNRTSHAPLKINFWGHEESSNIFMTETFFKLFSNNEILNVELSKLYSSIFFAISYHLDIYNRTNYDDEKLIKFLGNKTNCDFITRLMDADLKGQFTLSEDSENRNFINRIINLSLTSPLLYKKDYKQFTDKDIKITFYCGLPGSGKDTLAKKLNHSNILSFDDIRIKTYLNENPTIKLENFACKDLLYKDAWKFTKNHNIKEKLCEEIKELIIFGENEFCICNTNINIKSRKELIEKIKNYFPNLKIVFYCVFVVSPLETCINRDLNRKNEDKSVGKEVIWKFALIQRCPTEIEGFNIIYCCVLNP